jgi:hypothetical protein
MARKPLRHQVEASERAREHVGRMTQHMMEQARAARTPAGRLYPGGPKGGPTPPAQRPDQRVSITPTDVHKIEQALGGTKAHAVLAALKSAGLVGGGPRAAPPNQSQDSRGATSPLGGQALRSY